jgi:hypothetical protein
MGCDGLIKVHKILHSYLTLVRKKRDVRLFLSSSA